MPLFPLQAPSIRCDSAASAVNYDLARLVEFTREDGWLVLSQRGAAEAAALSGYEAEVGPAPPQGVRLVGRVSGRKIYMDPFFVDEGYAFRTDDGVVCKTAVGIIHITEAEMRERLRLETAGPPGAGTADLDLDAGQPPELLFGGVRRLDGMLADANAAADDPPDPPTEPDLPLFN